MAFDKEDFVRFLARSKKQKELDDKRVEYSSDELSDEGPKKGLMQTAPEALGLIAQGAADVLGTPDRMAEKRTAPYREGIAKMIGDKRLADLAEQSASMVGSIENAGGKLIKFPKAFKPSNVEADVATPSNVESFEGFGKKLFGRARESLADEDLAKAEAFQEKLPWGSAGREVRNSPEHLSGSEMASLQKQKQSSDAWEAAKPNLDPESVQIIDIVSKNKKASPEAIERLKGMAISGMSPDEIKMASYRKILPRSYYKQPEYQGIQAASEAQDAAQYESKIKNWQRENVLQFPKEKSMNAPKEIKGELNTIYSNPDRPIPDPPMHKTEGNLVDFGNYKFFKENPDHPALKGLSENPKPQGRFKDPLKNEFEALLASQNAKPKMGQLLEFPKDRMGPVQDRSSIPFDANFRVEGKNIVKFPNKYEDYERLIKADMPHNKGAFTEKSSALDNFMARFGQGPDADRVLREISKIPETSPYVYLDGDTHNIVYAPASRTWKNDGFRSRAGTGGVSSVPRGTTPDKLPTNAQGQKVLGEGVELGTNDPLMWMDRKYGVTKKLLEDAFDTPMVIKTRSDLVAVDEYLEKLNPSKHTVEMHAMTPNEHVGRIIEPGAPSFKRRIEAIQRLKEAGVPVKLKMDVLQPIEGKLPPSLQNAKSEWAEYLSTFPELQSIIEPNYIKLDKAALDRLKRELGE
jgi:hypothetical protein